MSLKLVYLTKCSGALRKTFPVIIPNVTDSVRTFSSDHQSIVDKYAPGIRSPFENPRRVRQDSNLLTIEPTHVEDDVKLVHSKIIEENEPIVKPLTQADDPNVAAASTSQAVQTITFLERLGFNKIDDDLPEEEKKRLRIARNTKLGMVFLALGTTAGLIWFCFHYGRSKRDEHGVIIPDPYSGSLLAPVYRITDGFRDWMNYAVEPSREKLLPDPLKAPYIQPKYTLVIEMKNVLVSPEWTYKTGYRFKKRPALEYFLDVVGYPNFELVIYTSEPPMSAFGVIDHIDTKQRIMYRLFRDCTKYVNGHHVKDLDKLNRDLSKVIFIDFDPESAKYNPENMLRLPKWDGDMDDTALVDLAELLKTIYVSDVEDVRPVLQFYSSYDNPTSEFRRRAIELAEREKQAKEQSQNQSTLRKYAGFFGLRRHNV